MIYPRHRRGAIGDNWAIGGVALLIIIISGYFIFFSGGPDTRPTGPWYFKCWKPAAEGGGCGYELTITRYKEYRAMMPAHDPASAEDIDFFEETGPTKLPCPGCESESLYQALKCPEHGIYVPSMYINPNHPAANDACTTDGCAAGHDGSPYSPSVEKAREWSEKQGR